MHGDITNEVRAGWALEAVKAFGLQTGQIRPGERIDLEDSELFEQIASEFIADLAHLARLNGYDIDHLVDRGIAVYVDEVAEAEVVGL